MAPSGVICIRTPSPISPVTAASRAFTLFRAFISFRQVGDPAKYAKTYASHAGHEFLQCGNSLSSGPTFASATNVAHRCSLLLPEPLPDRLRLPLATMPSTSSLCTTGDPGGSAADAAQIVDNRDPEHVAAVVVRRPPDASIPIHVARGTGVRPARGLIVSPARR